jgi:endonuclease IV
MSKIKREVRRLKAIKECHDSFIKNCTETVLDELAGTTGINDKEFDTLSKIIDKYHKVSKIYSDGEGRGDYGDE